MRRAAPHQAVLAKEAARQQRFDAWKSDLSLEQEALSCTIDSTARCALRVLWPSSRLAVGFSGLACAAPPPPPTDTTASSTASSAPPVPLAVTWLPALPEASHVTLLPGELVKLSVVDVDALVDD